VPRQRQRSEPTTAPSHLIATPQGDPGPGRLRPFGRADLSEVVALRQQVYPLSERPTRDALTAYAERILLHNPWRDEELPSWVYEDERGRVVGFLGVIPRPMVFQAKPIRVAVATQLMVAAEHRGLVGGRLVRAFLRGPQDLSLSDAANDAARRVWESSGGRTSLIHGFSWTRVLRPCRHLSLRFADSFILRAGLLAGRPLLAAADAAVARLGDTATQPPPGATEPVDAAALLGHFGDVGGEVPLRPRYDAASFDWLLEQLAEKRDLGSLQHALVWDGAGRVVGWFILFLKRGGVSQVVQVAARRSARALVLRHLYHQAWRGGAAAVSGRLDPALLNDLAAQGCVFHREGPWMLIHSCRPELMLAVEQGGTFPSRLEGEWWLTF